jgi:predicted porin
MPGAQVSLIVISLKQTNQGNVAGEDIKQNGFVVSWEQVFGNIQALAQVARSAKATGCNATVCDNTDSQSYMIGARYLLSKRTAVYATYNKTTNKDNANLDYKSAGYNAVANIGNGADPQILGVGILHNF